MLVLASSHTHQGKAQQQAASQGPLTTAEHNLKIGSPSAELASAGADAQLWK